MSTWTALIILLVFTGIFVVLFLWRSRFEEPALFFSQANLLKNKPKTGKELYSDLPKKLLLAAMVFFAIAFVDPHYYSLKPGAEIQEEIVPTEGLAIYLVLDKSGSMGQKIGQSTKLDRLKGVTRRFVEGRPNDLLGLVAFARGAQVLSPLTLDHKTIGDQLDQLEYVRDKTQDGTSIGYAIYKTANLIAATRHYAEYLVGEKGSSYDIKDGVVVLVTDGFQSPSPLDAGKRFRNIEVDEAARYAKEKGIRLYVVNVDPKLGQQKFSAYRGLMEQVTALTGGRFFWADRPDDIDRIYAEIDRLEKSIIPQSVVSVRPSKSEMPHLYRKVSFNDFFLFLGLICLLGSVIFETKILRRAP